MKLNTKRNIFLCFLILVILSCGIFGLLISAPATASASTENTDISQPLSMKGFKSGNVIPNNCITKERVIVTLTNKNYTRLYYKSPLAEEYSFTTDRIYITEYENGSYYFYATTDDGHSSSEYSIYYDDKKPIGAVYSNGDVSEEYCYLTGDFSYSAKDNESGIAEIYYKTPQSNDYLIYSAGSIIPSDSGDGQYSFYSIDNAGNISETLTVFLETKIPVVKMYRNDRKVYDNPIVNGEKIDTDIYFCPNDTLKIICDTSSGIVTSNYKLDTDITINDTYTENEYLIDLTSVTGISAQLKYHIVHNKPSIEIDGKEYFDGDVLYFNSDKTINFKCDPSIEDLKDTGAAISTDGNISKVEYVSYSSGIGKVLMTADGTETKYNLHLNDRGGNQAAITVIIDKFAAVGFWEADGIELNDGSYTNKPISFIYTENGVKAKYSFNGEAYKDYESGQTFTRDGTYIIVLTDQSKNERIYKIHIDTIAPTGQLYANNIPVKSGTKTKEEIYFTWEEEIAVTVNGVPYIKNSVLLVDNEYEFILTDKAGNKQIYNIIIDTAAPTISLNGIENGGKGNVTVTITELSEEGTVTVYKDGVQIEYNLGDELKDYGNYEVRVSDELGNERIYKFVLEYRMNGGAIALIVISILIMAGIIVAIIFGKKAVYKRKFRNAPKLTDDELFEQELNARFEENTDEDSNT